jgi:hypothetical protein
MEEKIVMILNHDGNQIDIEAPKGITANEFIFAINSGFSLGMDLSNPDICFMRSRNPVALIRGEKTLEELGLRNGSSIYC